MYVLFFQDKIYLRGTPDYIKKEKEFTIKIPQAIKILREYEKNRSKKNMYTHAFIKNNDYVFSKEIWKTGASLEGVYINGYTGKVRYIHYGRIGPFNRLGPFNQFRLNIYCGSKFQSLKKDKNSYVSEGELLLHQQLNRKQRAEPELKK